MPNIDDITVSLQARAEDRDVANELAAIRRRHLGRRRPRTARLGQGAPGRGRRRVARAESDRGCPRIRSGVCRRVRAA